MAATDRRRLSAYERRRRRRLLADPRAGRQGSRHRGLRLRRRARDDRTIPRGRLDAIPPRGAQAALTVPGAVGGWALALELSAAVGGRLPLGFLLESAIRHARDGYPVSRSEARFDAARDQALIAAPGFAETYFIDGKPAKAGDRARPPRSAETLGQLAHAGLDDFYRGDVARKSPRDLERLGSPVTRGRPESLSRRLAPAALAADQRRDALQHASADARARLADPDGPFRAAQCARCRELRLLPRLDRGVQAGVVDLRPRGHAISTSSSHDCADFLTPEALDREAATIDMAAPRLAAEDRPGRHDLDGRDRRAG